MAGKAVADGNRETALATVETSTGMLAPTPSYLTGIGREGMDNFAQSDMQIPRLSLAQSQSPQAIKGTPDYINGLEPGMFFNSMTGQNYGQEVFVQIIRKNPVRAMEFYDIKDGGGVKDPNVPLDDDRLKWGVNGEKPKATTFRDYVAVIVPSREIIGLSFKAGGIKVAKVLNGLIVTRNQAIYAGRYRITSALELKPQAHHVFHVENADWVTEEDLIAGRRMYEAIKDLDLELEIKTERVVPGAPGGEPIPF